MKAEIDFVEVDENSFGIVSHNEFFRMESNILINKFSKKLNKIGPLSIFVLVLIGCLIISLNYL